MERTFKIEIVSSASLLVLVLSDELLALATKPSFFYIHPRQHLLDVCTRNGKRISEV